MLIIEINRFILLSVIIKKYSFKKLTYTRYIQRITPIQLDINGPYTLRSCKDKYFNFMFLSLIRTIPGK